MAGEGLRLRGEGVLSAGKERRGHDLVVENGRVAAVVVRDAVAPGYPVRTVQGWLAPGLVDMHTHGIAGVSYDSADDDALGRAREALWRHGVAAFVASLPTLPLEGARRAIDTLSRWTGRREPGRATLLGVHLEGPYLSPLRRGAHPPELLRTPDEQEVLSLVDARPGAVRMMTLAPELAGALALVPILHERGIVAALGHTDATASEMDAAFALGACHATHLWNAMSPLGHRSPGAVGSILTGRRTTAELICDGHHLAPRVAALSVRALGPHRVALVTDAMAAADGGDGLYDLGTKRVRVTDGVARLADGTLAGSTLTLDRAVRNVVEWGAATRPWAHAMASSVPARIIGAEAFGVLRRGAAADCVVVDEDGTVRPLDPAFA